MCEQVRQHVLGVDPLGVDLPRLQARRFSASRRACGSRPRARRSVHFSTRSRSFGSTRSRTGTPWKVLVTFPKCRRRAPARAPSRAAAGRPRAPPGSPSSGRTARTADRRRAGAPRRDRRRERRCRCARDRREVRCARARDSASAREEATGRKLVPHVLPDEAVAENAVAQDRVHVPVRVSRHAACERRGASRPRPARTTRCHPRREM